MKFFFKKIFFKSSVTWRLSVTRSLKRSLPEYPKWQLEKTYFLKAIKPISFFLFTLTSCNIQSKIDHLNLPTFSEKGINMVVEIPAGTNHKIEINKSTGVFENDIKKGNKRLVQFLPYPGNYGFIPSTYMDESRGGDGDALDILVISESQETGTVLEIKPIATLLLRDNGELDTKLIGVPVDSSQNILQVNDFQDFRINHWASMNIIEQWFLNYKGLGQMELLGWKDDGFALSEIKKWAIKN